MRTRCPRCQTIFRITPEQLRARAGKVRCGNCQAVFNALESLIEEPPALPTPSPPVPEAPPAIESAPIRESATESTPEAIPEPEPEQEIQPEPEPPGKGASAQSDLEAGPTSDQAERDETTEESTQAARKAGLVAARELTETPGYNRWATAPLAGLEQETRRRTNWPFVAASTLLSLMLTAQLAFHFRTELIQRLPALGGAFSALDIEVPLPRQSDLVSIEASDLQADSARGLLVLQATLKNRAPYAQAWPALELSLTDTHDAVIARRVLQAADYLPPKADPEAFAANSETGVRLWIDAREVGAAGYRLYVFYP